VLAMCITHQRETFVVTDESGTPIHPALVWMDKRATSWLRKLAARPGFDGDALHRLTGKPVCTTPSIYKLGFLTSERAAIFDTPRTLMMLDVHGFLAWRITGRAVTSLASADPMGLVDMQRREWAPSLLVDVGGMPQGGYRFADLVEPGVVLGTVSEEAHAVTSLPVGLPVVAGAGDGQCAGLGAGIVAPGRAYLNLGTAVVSGVLSREYCVDRAFRTLYGAMPGSYFLETDLQGGTFTVNWLCERLLGRSLDALGELEAQASQLAPGAEGLMLVPYWNGVMNPYWDDDASGLVIGFRGHHGAAHLYRALLEGIAFEQRLHTSGVERVAGPISEMVVMGGGSKSALWCQILADVLEKPIVRAASSEATALGAGILAAAQAGLHATVQDAAAAMTRLGERFEPQSADRYRSLYDAYIELYPAVAASLRKLATSRAP
ncbi:MAG TPA: FGGY-family carbohydrate kinase, partial [Polyangiaceae bacterium]|nr:FGGY-family carbohydrate kinase [Polyangiaceae bacterium]